MIETDFTGYPQSEASTDILDLQAYNLFLGLSEKKTDLGKLLLRILFMLTGFSVYTI